MINVFKDIIDSDDVRVLTDFHDVNFGFDQF